MNIEKKVLVSITIAILLLCWLSRYKLLYVTSMFYYVHIAGMSDDYSDISAPSLIVKYRTQILPYLVNDIKEKKPEYMLYAGIYLRDIIRNTNMEIDEEIKTILKSTHEFFDQDILWGPSLEIFLIVEREYALEKIRELLVAEHEEFKLKLACDRILRLLALPSNRVPEIERDICALAGSKDSGIRLGVQLYTEYHSVNCKDINN